MRKYVFILYAVFICKIVLAQNSDSIDSDQRRLFRVNFSTDLNWGLGAANFETSSEYQYVFTNFIYRQIGFSFPNMQLIFFDRIGLNAGIYMTSFGSAKKRMKENLQNAFPNYYVDVQNSQFYDSYQTIFYKIGLCGFFKSKNQRTTLVPSINLLHSSRTNYPDYYFDMKEHNSNYMFRRTYKFDNTETFGINYSFSARSYLMEFEKCKSFFSYKVEANYMHTAAFASYTDKDMYGVSTKSVSSPVSKDFYILTIGAGLGIEF